MVHRYSRREVLRIGAASAAATAMGTGTRASAQEMKIEMWGVSSPAHEKAVKSTAEEIKGRTGIQIDYVRAPAGWNSQLERLNAALASGNVPDIVHIKDLHLWNYASRDQVISLDDFYGKSSIKTDGFRKSIWDAMHYEGNVYGAPWKGSFIWLQFVNHGLMADAGLDPVKDVPKTWNDLMSASQKMTDPATSRYGHTFYSYGTEPSFFLYTALVGQAGGKAMVDGELNLTSPEAIEAMQWMLDMIWTNKVSVPPDRMQNIWDVVKAERVGAWQNGLWFKDEALATAPDLKWSIHAIPGYKTNENVDTPECLIIPKGAKNPELSFKAIEQLLAPSVDLDHALVQGFLPAYKENLDRLGDTATDSKDVFKAYAEIGKNPDIRSRYWAKGYDEMVTAILPELQAVWFNQVSAKDGLATAQDVGNAILKRVRETGR